MIFVGFFCSEVVGRNAVRWGARAIRVVCCFGKESTYVSLVYYSRV